MMLRKDKLLLWAFILSLAVNMLGLLYRRFSARSEQETSPSSLKATCSNQQVEQVCSCPSGKQQSSTYLSDKVVSKPPEDEDVLKKQYKQCRVFAKKEQLEREKPEASLNEDELRRRLRTLCWYNDTQSCRRLLELQEKLCKESKKDWICISRAMMYIYENKGIERNIPLGLSLLQEHCQKPGDSSCDVLGNLYLHGPESARDLQKGISAYKTACDPEQNPYQCNGLAKLYENGTMGTVDKTQALSLYKQACQGGNPDACIQTSRLYKEGFGSKQEQMELDAAMIEKCHKTNESTACWWLAQKYMDTNP